MFKVISILSVAFLVSMPLTVNTAVHMQTRRLVLIVKVGMPILRMSRV